jgi:hypothetical protein
VVGRLDPFVAATLPALFGLGELTIAALRHNTVENIVLLQRMERIRAYYRRLVPEAEEFFDDPGSGPLYETAMATVGLRPAPVQMLFTGASVVAAINSVVGGTGVALLVGRFGHADDAVAAAVGVVVAAVAFVLHLLYQQRTNPSP